MRWTQTRRRGQTRSLATADSVAQTSPLGGHMTTLWSDKSDVDLPPAGRRRNSKPSGFDIRPRPPHVAQSRWPLSEGVNQYSSFNYRFSFDESRVEGVRSSNVTASFCAPLSLDKKRTLIMQPKVSCTRLLLALHTSATLISLLTPFFLRRRK